MNTLIYSQHEQGTPEWLEARKGAITGSCFKLARDYSDGLTDQQRKYWKAMVEQGMSEAQAREFAGYKAAPKSEALSRALDTKKLEKVWGNKALAYAYDLARERCGGKAPDKFQTIAMRTGSEQEDAARSKYEAKTGSLVEEVGFIHTTDRCFGVSPDGLIGKEGALEIKTMYSSDTLFKALVDGDVSEYRDQCLGYMWLLGVQWVDLCLWVYDIGHLKVIRIKRDEAEIEQLEEDLQDFARLVRSYEYRLTQALAA